MYRRSNSNSTRWLVLLLLVLLSACGPTGNTPTQPVSQATSVATATTVAALASPTTEPVSQATSVATATTVAAPESPTPIAVATGASTPAPATSEATGASTPAPATDETWQVAGTGDLNGDGVPEQVIYQPSDLVPADTFKRPGYELYTLVAREVRIVQPAAGGQAQPLVTISLAGLMAERNLASFGGTPERSPAALLVSVDVAGSVPVEVIPLQTDGDAYAQGVGVYWNQAEQAYRLASASAGAMPTPG